MYNNIVFLVNFTSYKYISYIQYIYDSVKSSLSRKR